MKSPQKLSNVVQCSYLQWLTLLDIRVLSWASSMPMRLSVCQIACMPASLPVCLKETQSKRVKTIQWIPHTHSETNIITKPLERNCRAKRVVNTWNLRQCTMHAQFYKSTSRVCMYVYVGVWVYVSLNVCLLHTAQTIATLLSDTYVINVFILTCPVHPPPPPYHRRPLYTTPYLLLNIWGCVCTGPICLL